MTATRWRVRKAFGICIAIVLGVILGVYSIHYEPEQESYYTTGNIANFCQDQKHEQECVPFDQYKKSVGRLFQALGDKSIKSQIRWREGHSSTTHCKR